MTAYDVVRLKEQIVSKPKICSTWNYLPKCTNKTEISLGDTPLIRLA